jgi:hypothetical protein
VVEETRSDHRGLNLLEDKFFFFFPTLAEVLAEDLMHLDLSTT